MDPGTAFAIVDFGVSIGGFINDARNRWKDMHKIPEEIEDLLLFLGALERYSGLLYAQSNQDGMPVGMWDSSAAKRTLDEAMELHRKIRDLNLGFQAKIESSKGLKRKLALAKVYRQRESAQAMEQKLGMILKMTDIALAEWKYSARPFERRLLAQAIKAEIIPKPTDREIRHLIQNSPESRKSQTFLTNQAKRLLSPDGLCYMPSWLGQVGVQSTGQGWTAFLKTPAWVAQRVWEFHYMQTYSIVSVGLRTYNIISKSAAVFGLIQLGDVGGLMNLFRSGQASPLDRDENGLSLLYFAAKGRQVDVCKVLLEMGSSDMIDDRSNTVQESPLDISIMETTCWHAERGEFYSYDGKSEEMQALFRSKLGTSYDVPATRALDFIREPDFGDEHVTYFRRTIMKDYYDWPLSERLEAVRMGSFNLRRTPALIELLKNDERITESDVAASVREKVSLVHSVAVALGKRYSDAVMTSSEPFYINPSRLFTDYWSILVTDVARASLPEHLHSIERVTPWDDYGVPSWEGTPLVSLVGGVLCHISEFDKTEWNHVIQEVLKMWLECLADAGVDLDQYGKKESRAWESACKGAFDGVWRSSTCMRMDQRTLTTNPLKSKDNKPWIPMRFTALSYGARPEDWRIWWAPDVEAWAGEFWETALQPMSRMPGEWIESV